MSQSNQPDDCPDCADDFLEAMEKQQIERQLGNSPELLVGVLGVDRFKRMVEADPVRLLVAVDDFLEGETTQ